MGKDATLVNIEIENIRRRWYIVTISGSPGLHIIGPGNRKGSLSKIQLKKMPVISGEGIAIFADGGTPFALAMHAFDLVHIGATGRPISGSLIKRGHIRRGQVLL